MNDTLWKPSFFAEHPATRPLFPRRAWCLNVVDGDTIDAMVEMGIDVYRYTRVRLLRVDCPEIFHPKTPEEKALGMKAKAAVESLCLNKPILLNFHTEEQIQGRMIGSITYYSGAAPLDLADYLTRNHLLKSDVVVL